MNIFIEGPQGSGKTSTAHYIAKGHIALTQRRAPREDDVLEINIVYPGLGTRGICHDLRLKRFEVVIFDGLPEAGLGLCKAAMRLYREQTGRKNLLAIFISL